MSTKTEPRLVTHSRSYRDHAKGRCGKRGGKHSRITTILAIVDCPDCRPSLRPATYTAINAMHFMAGAKS